METIRSIGRQYSNSKRTTRRDSDGDGDGKGVFKAADVLDLHYALNYLLRWECFNNYLFTTSYQTRSEFYKLYCPLYL